MPKNEPSLESQTSSRNAKSAESALPTLLDQVVLALATGLGTGLSPIAPGTVGSLLGPPMVWGCTLVLPPLGLLAVATVFIAIGPAICTRASKLLDSHDPGSVVYDEIAAFWLVFAPQLTMGQELTLPILLAGFILFRIFDISKWWPVSHLEKLPDGTGIMADDLAAGAMAGAVLAIGVAVAGWV